MIPDAIVGDIDSILPELKNNLPQKLLFHIKEQSTSDIDKALRHCLKMKYNEINILAADGGRQDHFLANLEVLYKYSPKARIIIWTAIERMEFISDEWIENVALGQTVSLIPIFGSVGGIHTQGLKYSITNASLSPGSTPSGISNQVISNPVKINIQDGRLLLVVQHCYSDSKSS